MRTVSESTEPKMSVTHECGNVIEYYLSDLMGKDQKELRCVCGGKVELPLPNYMMVQMENGKPILRIDLGLVLTESALNDPHELLAAWLSHVHHVSYPLSESKQKLLPKLPESYHQTWWSK